MDGWRQLCAAAVVGVVGYRIAAAYKRSLNEKAINAFHEELHHGTAGYPAHWG